MYWLEKLKLFKLETGMTYKEISEKTGIPLTTVEKLFSGRTRDPKLTMITEIVHALNHSTGDLVAAEDSQAVEFKLSSDEQDMLLALRKLDIRGKKRVKDTITSELDRIAAEKNAIQCRYSKICIELQQQLNTSELFDNLTAKIAFLSEKPPRNTDYILRIADSCITPFFAIGDYIYIRKTECLQHGEIGIFIYDSSIYIAQFPFEKTISLNSNCKSSEIKCLGKVLGKVMGEVNISH